MNSSVVKQIGKSRLTASACLFCLLVFALELCLGGGLLNTAADTLLRFGASSGPLTIGQAEYARLLSYIFVHANILHLALNLYVLFDFGPVAESSLGRKMYVFVFLFAGIMGALVSIFWDQTQTTVGASAAILGLLGAVIFKSWFQKEKADFSRPQLIMLCIFLLYSLLLGFTSDLIDNAAHLGGFFAGVMVIAAVYGTRPEAKPSTARLTIAASLLPLSIPLLIWADGQKVHNNPDIEAYKAHKEAIELIDKKEFAPALAKLDAAQAAATKKDSSILFDRAIALNEVGRSPEALNDMKNWMKANKDDAAGLVQKAAILHKMHQDREAITALDEALKQKPFSLMDAFTLNTKKRGNPALLYNNRAWFKLAAGEAKEALLDCDQATTLAPNMSTSFDTRGVAYLVLKDWEQAKKDFTHAIELNKREIKNRPGATEDGAEYYHRAIARQAMGDKVGAEEDLARYKTLKYEPEDWEPKFQESKEENN